MLLYNRSPKLLNLAVAIIGENKDSFSVNLDGQKGVSVFELSGNSSVRLKVHYK